MARIIPLLLLIIILSFTNAESSPVYLLIVIFILISLSVYNISIGLANFIAGPKVRSNYKWASASLAAIVTIALLLKTLRQLRLSDFILLGIFSLLTIIYINRVNRQ